MTTCGKCGAELVGTEKFCATCGAPTGIAQAPAPGSGPGVPIKDIGGSNMVVALPDERDVPPPSNVNPFAVTASPSGSRLPAASGSSPAIKVVDAALQAPAVAFAPKPESSPPPAKPGPSGKSDSENPRPMSPRVSPLAMSNGVSGPTPFSEALEKARKAINTPLPSSAVAAPLPKKMPGTQMMVNAPKIPPVAKAAEAPKSGADEAAKKKPVPKTVAMDFNPRAQPAQPQPSPTARAVPNSSAPGSMPGSVPGSMQGSIPQSAPPPGFQPHQQGAPQSAPPGGIPQSAIGQAPQSAGVPPGSMPRQFPSGTGIPAQGAQAPPPQSFGYPYPQQQPQQGWAPPPQPPQPQFPAYFGYQPGARVQVTWSNGHRYPATVQQTTGAQCLVVFPDGQQHWVEMQYLTPG